MKVEIKGTRCIVTREKGDPRFSGVREAAGESRLLYHVKNALNEQGYDLIKKRMWKDGHLVDDKQQYLRTRRPGAGKADIAIFNNMWAIRGAEEPFNKDGEVILRVEENFFNAED